MSYSLNTNGKPAAPKPGGGLDAVNVEPMKRMPPRVILHPNGRPKASMASTAPATTNGRGGTSSHGGGSKKLVAATVNGTAALDSQPSSTNVSPPGAAAALHVMQNNNNPNAFPLPTMLPSSDNMHRGPNNASTSSNADASVTSTAPHAVSTEMLMKKTEDQMADLRRKLSVIHADIRRLSPSAAASLEPGSGQPRQLNTLSSDTTAAPQPQQQASSVPSRPTASNRSSLNNSTSASPKPAPHSSSKGAVHHLLPLPVSQPSAEATPAAGKSALKGGGAPAAANQATKPTPAAAPAAAPAATGGRSGGVTITEERRLSLEDNGFLESPGGSSSDGSSSSSSDSDSDSDEKKPAAAQPAKKAGQAGGAATAPARQGFGFKRPEKPPGDAVAQPKGRGIHMAGGDEAATSAAGSAPAKRLSGEATNTSNADTVPLGRTSAGAARRSSGDAESAARRGRLFSSIPNGDSGHDNAQAVDALDKNSRSRTQAVKSLREQFFAAVPRQDEVLGENASNKAAIASIRLPGTPCSWLCCISLAISFVAGVPTTLEKVLKTNHLGVHHLGLQAITLAQLYDLTNDYIHARFHRNLSYNAHCTEDEFDDDEEASEYLTAEELKMLPHVHCEMATMDSEVIDPVEESEASYGMGEHAPVTSLAQFRKELLAHINDEKSLFIFNYDPYVIEEHETRLRANNAESEEEEAAIWAGMLNKKGQSQGAFGLLLSFNPVQHTVTIVSPHITKEQFPMRGAAKNQLSEEAKKNLAKFGPTLANLVLEEHTISLQTLYEATRQRDNYTQLCRGFVRIFISEDFAPKVPSIFPLYVLDGSSAAGLMTTTLDVSVAPHVLGLAMMHHLTITFLLSDNARRKQSSRNLLNKANVCDVKLRGIPLTKIIQQLRLPLSVFVGQSNRESVAMAYAWYTVFLQQLQVGSDVRLGLVRPERRGGADDGQPSIDEDEFLAHLKTAMSTESVMLISFDINVALNVRITSTPEPAHFAIVIGVDEERGIVRLADVNVKRFRKTWHIPFYRLYNAVMGYGYIMAAKDKKTIKALNGKKDQEEVLQCGRYVLPPVPSNPVERFEYPSKAYALTVLADAVNRLGFRSDVERFLNYSGFHITYFLSRHLPLEGAAFVTQNFSHYALDDAVSVSTKHYDYTANSAPPAPLVSAAANAASRRSSVSAVAEKNMRTEEELLEDITYALASPSTRQLVVKFDAAVISADVHVFNGSGKGGCYAIVVDYDASTSTVVLSDCNPVSFYRTFGVPLSLLFAAISVWDGEDMRARGTMLLTTDQSQESVYDNTKGFDFAHALVHHPFRPVFSPFCSCIALAATELMMNIEAPTMLGGAPLAVEDEEKRQYKRYNNIFSAEDILYALPSFSVHAWQSDTSNMHSSNLAASANAAFKQLHLPLIAMDITRGDATDSSASPSSPPGATGNFGADVLTDPSAFLRACNGISGLLTITLLAYDTGKLYGVPGTSMGIVNRVESNDDDEDEDEDEDDHEDGGSSSVSTRRRARLASGSSKGSVQLLEGEPCRWGAVCERPAEELMACVTAILCIMEVVEEGNEDA